MTTLYHRMLVLKGCQRKKQFVSVEEAQMRIREIERQSGDVLYWYQCRYCHACHLTKKPNANPRYRNGA